jgi:hypothetical protein
MFESVNVLFAFVLLACGLSLAVLLALKLYESPRRPAADADAAPEPLSLEASR